MRDTREQAIRRLHAIAATSDEETGPALSQIADILAAAPDAELQTELSCANHNLENAYAEIVELRKKQAILQGQLEKALAAADAELRELRARQEEAEEWDAHASPLWKSRRKAELRSAIAAREKELEG